MEIYVVKEEDSIDDIAEALEISPQQLIFDNQLIYPYALAIGQALSGRTRAAQQHSRQHNSDYMQCMFLHICLLSYYCVSCKRH